MKTFYLTAASSMLGLTLVLSPMANLQAAEIRIVAGPAMSGVLGELGPQFERNFGHKLIVHYGPLPDLIKQVVSGEPFDLVIVPVEVIDDTAARGRFAPGSRTDIARVGVGVAVRAGQPKPDISSPATLKQTLLRAKSVTFLPESGNGAHILKVFERLGISEAMKAKTIPQTAPLQVAQAVARGEAELGLFVTNLLIVPGVELVGSFPDELQLYLVFAAAVGAEAKEAQGARDLVEDLRTLAAAAVIKTKGMEPLFR
jgi:molybdate transport system substrate-binding protein